MKSKKNHVLFSSSDQEDPPWIVATDLDGTLLDHDSYSWEAARPGLKALSAVGIPVVIVTSKTAAEVEVLRTDLGNEDAFITENGGFVRYPDGAHFVLGATRAFILESIKKVRMPGLRFEGFSEMTVQRIADLTGLSIRDATNAACRQSSEPLYWEDTEENWRTFSAALRSMGLTTTIGGRFRHVMGETSKAEALAKVADWYARRDGTVPRILALGDSENDAGMLASADCAIWVRKRGPTPETALKPGGRCSLAFGPQGWSECLLEFFAQEGIVQPRDNGT